MWLPHTLPHIINSHSFSLRYEEHRKQSHHNDPSTEEEEYPRSHPAKHRQESLRDHEREEHVARDRNSEPCTSSF